MKDNYYFDNAATSWPKPEPVYAYMDEFARTAAVNPGRAGHAMAVESQIMVQQTRQMLAEFFNFNGGTERVVFSLNATDSINQLLSGLLNAGDHVITSVLEHNALVRPLNHQQRDQGISVSQIRVSADGYVSPAAIEAAITANTRLIFLNHASNVLGSVQDIASVGAIARRHKIVFAIDTAQTAGVIPIDMQQCQAGVLVFTGHKGLFGPMGTGGMIVSEEVELHASRFGGTGVNSVAAYHPQEYPYRLEAGTIAVQGIAGLHAAQKWFRELGKRLLRDDSAAAFNLCSAALTAIAAHEMRHTNMIIDAFAKIDKVTVFGPQAGLKSRVATLSFIIDGQSPIVVAERLDADYHICVRAGLHCAPWAHKHLGTLESEGAVRVAPGYFTDDNDVRHLVDAVTEIAANA